MKGLDGQIDHGPHVARAQRRHDVGVRPGERHAVESQLMDNRAALLAHEVVLEVDPALVAAHAGTHAVVAHRHHAGTDAEAPANV